MSINIRTLISNPDQPIPVFRSQNQLYRDYFLSFLNHTNEKQGIWSWFENELLPKINSREVLIDLGAGNGQLLSRFLPFFTQCIAIEPNPTFAQDLLKLITPNNYYQTNILNTSNSLPKADLILESHVKYYIPISQWEVNTDRAISLLKPNGCLVEILLNQQADFPQMIAHFLGQDQVREIQHFAWQYSQKKGIEVKIDTRASYVKCESLEKMLEIAIFMINDVPSEVLENHPQRPTREQLARWIHENYYYSKGYYQMSCIQDFVQYFPLN
jgi:hypothetical protein